jgi:hypothetical protein
MYRVELISNGLVHVPLTVKIVQQFQICKEIELVGVTTKI